MPIGDLLNVIIPALESAGIPVLDDSVDESGLEVVIDGKIIRIAFLEVATGCELHRYSAVVLNRINAALAKYETAKLQGTS